MAGAATGQILHTAPAGDAEGVTSDLLARVEALAKCPVLLVASDFDGTIAPIAATPDAAEANREALVALAALARMPQTHVALISGRALADLARRLPDIDSLHLVGSHGSEYEADLTGALAPEARTLLARLEQAVRPLLDADPGFILERKPASLAFHYRNVSEEAAAAAIECIFTGPAAWPGVYSRPGKKVIELSVIATNKGVALQKLRQRLGVSGVVFLGDDATDEDAFALLLGPDVAVKVGPGQTRAQHRIADSFSVATVLAYLVERRADWLAGSHATDIERHTLLSDQRTFALLDPRGAVTWLCLPRLDSSAVFAGLLGGPAAGHFAIEPRPAAEPLRQEYVGDTFVVQTVWPSMTVTDYLDCGGGRAFQRAGRTDLIRVISGRGTVRVEFAPRLDFGRNETRLKVQPAGLEVEGSNDPLVLCVNSTLPWQIAREGRHESAVAEFELGDAPVVLELRYGTASLAADPSPEPMRRRRTEQFWAGWAATLVLPELARDLVRRSALVLKALCYGPTGAIAAAATTSLPEHAGGVRNWDYRCCWPRDAAMAASALVRLGMTGPAIKFLDWVLGILEKVEPGSMMCPVYTVTGAHLGAEGEIAELPGYRGSRPVRVGNAAAHQVQLDVFGPVADLVALLAERGAALSAEHWQMIEGMVTAVQRRWREPDHGIWEVRRPRQHHVHSKVMCWQTVDRALAVAAYLGRERPDWAMLRDEIATDVLEHGWRNERSAFCATYDDVEADAAVLAVGLSGLLRPDDPRFLSTLEDVENRLRVGPTVYRYRYDDGLPGIEGGFHLCTTWLIEAYALAGRIDDAFELFDRYIAMVGPTGLLSEEFEPRSRLALGNFPQAYAHLGLINAAVRLDGLRAGREAQAKSASLSTGG